MVHPRTILEWTMTYHKVQFNIWNTNFLSHNVFVQLFYTNSYHHSLGCFHGMVYTFCVKIGNTYNIKCSNT
jgi:hypothetical protein